MSFKIEGARLGVAPRAGMADAVGAARTIPTGEGGATKTMLSTKMVLIALSAGVLTGCATAGLEDAPTASAAPASGSRFTPRFPIRDDQAVAASATPAPAAPVARQDDRPLAAPTGEVVSQSLPPLAAPAAPRSAMSAPVDTAFASTADSDPPAQLILAAHHSRRARHEAAAHSSGLVTADGPVETRRGRTQSVVVKKGDTVTSLADRLGVSQDDLIKANGLKRPYHLAVGRKLKLPSAKGGAAKAYVVQHGDTLYAVSRRFDVPVSVLEDLNHFRHGAHLAVGQRVVLPGGGSAGLRSEAAEEAPPPPKKPTPPKPSRRVTSRLPAESSEETAPPPRPQPTPQPIAPSTPPAASAAPTHGPVPYTSLPGHLTGQYSPPPTRGSTPSYERGSSSLPPQPNGPPVVEAAPPPTDDQIAAAGRGRFVWPIRGQTLSTFGPKDGGQRNDGVDIAAAMDTPVMAAAAGDVVYAGNQVPGFGNLVLIKHADGWVTAYAHLSTTEVKIKDHVGQGMEIGRVGQSGGAVQPELHFEIRYAPTPRDKARPVNPALLLGTQ